MITKPHTFFGPVRNRNLAAIEFPAKALILALIGKLQEPGPHHPLGRAAQPPGPEPSKDVRTGGRRICRVKRARGRFIEIEPEIEFPQDGLPPGRIAGGLKTRLQVADDFLCPGVPLAPIEAFAQFPFVEPAKKIRVVVLVRLCQPGIENLRLVALPMDYLHLPLGQDHVGAEPRKDERAEKNAVAAVQLRPEQPCESGKGDFSGGELLELLAQIGIGHRPLQQ